MNKNQFKGVSEQSGKSALKLKVFMGFAGFIPNQYP